MVSIESLEKELQKMQKLLGNDYDVSNLPIELFSFDCRDIARHFYKQLEPLNPFFLVFGERYFGAVPYDFENAIQVSFSDELPSDKWDFKRELNPKPYESKEWGAHYVTCFNNLIPEPALGELIPLNDYSIRMFGRLVSYEKVNRL